MRERKTCLNLPIAMPLCPTPSFNYILISVARRLDDENIVPDRVAVIVVWEVHDARGEIKVIRLAQRLGKRNLGRMLAEGRVDGDPATKTLRILQAFNLAHRGACAARPERKSDRPGLFVLDREARPEARRAGENGVLEAHQRGPADERMMLRGRTRQEIRPGKILRLRQQFSPS